MKKLFCILSIIFGVLAGILFVVSVREVALDQETIKVANFQATVFAAACTVICSINVAAYYLCIWIENKTAVMERAMIECLSMIPAESEDGGDNNSVPVAADKNAEWIETTEGRLICPSCGADWSKVVIYSKKKCPECGQPAK